ncbi:hypothetical protein SUGI_1078920 [Cryptomeria japonica]|uniref:uncharacterized protein LOC131029320 n=1 Tax=Cryptomeria japonica TaxID=3369 RepID=UPI002414C9E3|nr:uncharacterized protein LOC131029320 [Cryptomeria japonica]GLJ50643.1 hypothetical protein SUGI_1078920 [Cryptomeria japonica]
MKKISDHFNMFKRRIQGCFEASKVERGSCSIQKDETQNHMSTSHETVEDTNVSDDSRPAYPSTCEAIETAVIKEETVKTLSVSVQERALKPVGRGPKAPTVKARSPGQYH